MRSGSGIVIWKGSLGKEEKVGINGPFSGSHVHIRLVLDTLPIPHSPYDMGVMEHREISALLVFWALKCHVFRMISRALQLSKIIKINFSLGKYNTIHVEKIKAYF